MYPKTVPHWIADVEVTPEDSAFFEKRNPATGEVIKIAASKTPRFSAGATLKGAVNPKKK